MPIRERSGNQAIAMDEMSTAMAQAVLAAETRAFGNKSAKLDLQMATAAFLRAKECLSVTTATENKLTQDGK